MGTKDNPGQFDCYQAAAPDEPMFVLLARDKLAPGLVEIWALLRTGATAAAQGVMNDLVHETMMTSGSALTVNTPKTLEARRCALAMVEWQLAHPPKPRRLSATADPAFAVDRAATEIGPGAPRA